MLDSGCSISKVTLVGFADGVDICNEKSRVEGDQGGMCLRTGTVVGTGESSIS